MLTKLTVHKIERTLTPTYCCDPKSLIFSQSLDSWAGAVALKGSPQEYDILCLWQPRDKHLRSGPFLRHTSPFTALQHDAHLHINSHQPPSSLYSHIRKTHIQAHKEADARTSLYSCAHTLAQAHAQTPQICVCALRMHPTARQAQAGTHVCTNRWFIQLLQPCLDVDPKCMC